MLDLKYSPYKNNPSASNKDIKRSVTKKLYMSSISSFHKNHLKSSSLLRKSQILKDKKEEKNNQNFSTKNDYNILHSSTLFFKPNFLNKIRNKENILANKSIDNQHFYKLRKEINKNMKNSYKSPYMEYLIQKPHFKYNNVEDYPKYYNYYQICHLMNKKKFKLSITYNEFLIFQDNQEYLIKYLRNNEQYIIMNYLLYFIYDKDKSFIAKNPKKILNNEEIKKMFFQLEENKYHLDGNMDILDKIGVYFRMSFSNLGKNIIFLEKLKPIINTKINYLYIKDIPKNLIPNCIPNIFPSFEKNKYLRIYFKSKKNNEIKLFDSYKEKDEDLNEMKIKSNNSKNFIFNNKLLKSKSESSYLRSSEGPSKLDDNFLGNVHFSSEEEDNTTNMISINQNKNHYNSNRRFINDNDIYDIELLIDNFNQTLGKKEYRPRKSKKKSTLKVNKLLIFNKEVDRHNSIKNDNTNNIEYKINEKDENILIQNKNSMNMKNNTIFRKIPKKEIFQTSLRGSNGIFNKNKKNKIIKPIKSQQSKNDRITNISNKYINNYSKNDIKYNNCNKSQINSNKSFIPFFLKKNAKKQTKNHFKKANNEFVESNILTLNKLKNNITSIKSKKNIKTNQSDKLIYNNFNFKIAQGKTFTNNIKHYDLPDVSNDNFKNIFGRQKVKIRKYLTLKQFEKIYEKIKKIGTIPKNKNFFHGNKYRSFSNFSGSDIFQNKEINEWAEKIEDETKIKNEYFIEHLKKKIKEENKKNKILSKNLCTMKQIIKSYNIYY